MVFLKLCNPREAGLTPDRSSVGDTEFSEFDNKEVFSCTQLLKTGGKQYRVAEGDVITIEKLEAAANESVTFEEVLTVVNDGDVKVGAPLVNGAKVTGTVLEHGKGKKILVFKYKAKSNYRRRQGHRQPFTKVRIESIQA